MFVCVWEKESWIRAAAVTERDDNEASAHKAVLPSDPLNALHDVTERCVWVCVRERGREPCWWWQPHCSLLWKKHGRLLVYMALGCLLAHMPTCLCVSERESGKSLSCLFYNPTWFSVMFYSTNNTSISYTVRDLRDIMQTLWLARTCISCLSFSLSQNDYTHPQKTAVVISTVATEQRDDAMDSGWNTKKLENLTHNWFPFCLLKWWRIRIVWLWCIFGKCRMHLVMMRINCGKINTLYLLSQVWVWGKSNVVAFGDASADPTMLYVSVVIRLTCGCAPRDQG